jgi:hypothetical protein
MKRIHLSHWSSTKSLAAMPPAHFEAIQRVNSGTDSLVYVLVGIYRNSNYSKGVAMSRKNFSVSTRICLFLLTKFMARRHRTIILDTQYIGLFTQLVPILSPVKVKPRSSIARF